MSPLTLFLAKLLGADAADHGRRDGGARTGHGSDGEADDRPTPAW